MTMPKKRLICLQEKSHLGILFGGHTSYVLICVHPAPFESAEPAKAVLTSFNLVISFWCFSIKVRSKTLLLTTSTLLQLWIWPQPCAYVTPLLQACFGFTCLGSHARRPSQKGTTSVKDTRSSIDSHGLPPS